MCQFYFPPDRPARRAFPASLADDYRANMHATELKKKYSATWPTLRRALVDMGVAIIRRKSPLPRRAPRPRPVYRPGELAKLVLRRWHDKSDPLWAGTSDVMRGIARDLRVPEIAVANIVARDHLRRLGF